MRIPWCWPVLLVLLAGEAAQGEVAIPQAVQSRRSFEWSSIYNQYVFTLYEGLKPRSQPDDNAEEINTPLKYLGRYFYVYRQSATVSSSKTSGEEWFLLARLDDESGNSRVVTVKEYLGWVPRKYVAPQGEALQDPVTGVHLKAFLRPSIAELEEAIDKTGRLRQIAARTQPKMDAQTAMELKFFNFYFVMAKTGDNSERDWAYLAMQYELGQDESHAQTVGIGWVELKYFQLWTTREAIQWSTAPGRPMHPGKIWASPDEALAAGPEANTDSRQYLFREPFDNGPVPQPPDWPRFPILRWEDAERYREKIQNQYPGWKLLRVCVPGGLVNEQGIPVASEADIANLQSRLAIIQQRLETLELMFVIDDTESMVDLFPHAARAVEQIVDSLRELPMRPQLRVGVTFYNDKTSTHFVPVEVTPLQPPDQLPRLIDKIRTHQVSAGGDPREMVFDGIKQAIDQAGFSSDRLKMLIVIGDDGDKSDENDPQHPQEKQIVSRLLHNYTTPISFIAIQVYPPERLDGRPPAMAFWKQMNTIAQLYNSEITQRANGDSSVIPATVYNVREASQVVTLILQAFNALLELQQKLQTDIRKMRLGNFSAVTTDTTIKKLFNTSGFDQEIIDKIRNVKGLQIVLDGYVWMPEDNFLAAMQNKCCTEYVLLLSAGELESVYSALRVFWAKIGTQWDTEKIKFIIEHALGEEDKTTIENLVIKMTALEGAKARLERILRGDVSLEDLKEIQVRMLRLNDILNEEQCDYRWRDGQWVRTSRQPTSRSFSLPDGLLKYYWVRVRDEWP